MKPNFSAKFFKNNRLRLRKLCGDSGLIIITANGVTQRNADVTYPFRQDSNFWYLTGVNEPDILLVIDGTEDYLIVPRRHQTTELFDGKVDLKQLKKDSGVSSVLSGKEGWAKLSSRISASSSASTLLPVSTHKAQEFYLNPARARLLRRIRGVNPGIQVSDVREQLSALRIIKQPEEIEAIQRAVDITTGTLNEIYKKGFKKYKHEYQIEADLLAGFRSRGARANSFEPIIAGGPNACQIHYVQNNAPLNHDDLILFDVGVEIENYASDISRTYSLGKPSARQRDIFNAVLEVQNFGIDQIKPGISFKDHDAKTRKFMGKKLKQLKLIHDDKISSINKYYPHISHFLGLDVHDTGNYQKPFEPGMVVTVEPGIYVPEEGIGVRIEDDVLVTENGCQVLSANLPRKL